PRAIWPASVYTCVFFFQAEDGIRDPLVTGVQTCALPISLVAMESAEQALPDPLPRGKFQLEAPAPPIPWPRARTARPPAALRLRSEERRVGKGCRSR